MQRVTNLFVCSVLLLTACASASIPSPPYLPFWNAYVANATLQYSLQPGCMPTRVAAATSQPYKGTVLLLHGYSACPQQFEDWMPLIAAEGYDVLAPLLPGHGAVPRTVWNGTATIIEDTLTFLPNDTQEYTEFSHRMGAVMAESEGERVVGGLSLGGAVATYAGTQVDPKNLTNPLYNRQLLMVPLLGLVSKLDDLFLSIINALPFLRFKVSGWGPGCDVERANGRNGYCTFTYSQAAAARDFGAGVLTNLQPVQGVTGRPMQTQVLFDWEDTAVSVPDVQDVYRRYAAAADGAGAAHTSVCVLPEPAEHSFLSKFDSPMQNKYWLDEITCRITSFVTQVNVDSRNTAARDRANAGDLTADGFLQKSDVPDVDPAHKGWVHCAFQCTNITCPYDRTATLVCPYTLPKPAFAPFLEEEASKGGAGQEVQLLASSSSSSSASSASTSRLSPPPSSSSSSSSSHASSRSSSPPLVSLDNEAGRPDADTASVNGPTDLSCFLHCCNTNCSTVGPLLMPACVGRCADDATCRYDMV